MAGRLYVLKFRPGDEVKILPDKTQILRVDPASAEAPGMYYAVVVEAVESAIAIPKIVVEK